MNKKFNSIYLGITIGIILPFICLFIYSIVNKYNITLGEILKTYVTENMYSSIKKEIIPKLLSLCLIPNLFAFFGFLQINKLLSARGIIIATILYGVLIVILKFLV